jgi:transaldolase
MIKIPGTQEGLEAVGTLLAEGINVNVTLLFSVQRYGDVLETYLAALEARLARAQSLERVASVASFFLSRIDVKVDAMLDGMSSDPTHAQEAGTLRGQAATACAALAYQHFQQVTQGPRWRRLADAGARVQRLLWASTGTKDPTYSDIKYIEPLIAGETVNTLPPDTLAAYRDHGRPALRMEQSIREATPVVARLKALGIDLGQVAGELEEEGIRKFVQPYQSLLASLDRLRQAG